MWCVIDLNVRSLTSAHEATITKTRSWILGRPESLDSAILNPVDRTSIFSHSFDGTLERWKYGASLFWKLKDEECYPIEQGMVVDRTTEARQRRQLYVL